MNKEKNEIQYLKAREVAGYVDYRNHLLFLDECDIDFEIGKQAYSDDIFSLDQIKNNKLAFLPLARQLQEMGLTVQDTLPWIETINEVVQIQRLDIKTAALYIAQGLRFSRQLGGLQRSIEQAQGELKKLNMTITQKQPVITTLLKLQQNGVKDDDIIGLSKIIEVQDLYPKRMWVWV